MTGQPEGPPNLTGASIGDIAAGLFGAINILSRLHARDCSNLELPASSIDMSMTDCQMALLENAMARTRNTDTPVGPIGTRHAASAPFQLFNTIGTPLVIAVASDDIWKRFCCMLGKFGNTLFNDARFQSVNSRNKNVDVLSDNLEKIFITRTRDAWLSDLQAANIPASPVNTIAEALSSPHASARNLVETITSQSGTQFDLMTLPFGADQSPSSPAPALGQHSSSVLSAAGYRADQISEFQTDGIIL